MRGRPADSIALLPVTRTSGKRRLDPTPPASRPVPPPEATSEAEEGCRAPPRRPWPPRSLAPTAVLSMWPPQGPRLCPFEAEKPMAKGRARA